MAYGLPDNLWIGLLVMAVIILAILWKDKISQRDPPPPPPGPSVSMNKTGSSTVGEEFALRGTYDPGSGSISDYSLTMNGRDITGETSWSGGTFSTGQITVPDVDTVECDVQVSATHGTADDSVSFNPSRPDEPEGPDLDVEVQTQDADPGEDNGAVTITADPDPGDNPIQETQVELPGFGVSDSSTGDNSVNLRETGIPPGEGYRYIARTTDGETPPVEEADTFSIRGHHEGNLRVEAGHEIVDPENGDVRIWAEVVSSPVELQGTTIKFRSVGAEDWRGTSEDGDRVEVTEELSPGTYEYEGLAVDVNDDRDTDRGTFQIEGEGDGGGSREDYPELVRVINQFSNQDFGDMGGFQGDGEVMSILEQILEQVDGSSGDDDTARAGMDAYQLLFALNALGVDLDGDGNQQIVNELRLIKQQMSGGGMSGDELENALRTVLHDVFGQDLQSVIQGLDLGDGFDEEAIVQAIENKNVDLSQVTNRLDNIESAVSQIQTQGGDMSDVEQKLDDIESAVRELKVDDQIFEDLVDEIENLRTEGVQIDVDENDPLIIKLVEDIERSKNPKLERRRIIQSIRRQGRLNRRLLVSLLDESGGEGNKNEDAQIGPVPMKNQRLSEVEGNMDPKIKKEIEELKSEYESLMSMMDETDLVEKMESRMTNEIDEIVEHLKKARQWEHKLEEHQEGRLENGEVQEQIEHDLYELKAQIERADDVIKQFKKDSREMRKAIEKLHDESSQFDNLTTKISEQEEALDDLDGKLNSVMKDLKNAGISVDNG